LGKGRLQMTTLNSEKQECTDLLVREAQSYSDTVKLIAFTNKIISDEKIEWQIAKVEEDVKFETGKVVEVDLVLTKSSLATLIEISVTFFPKTRGRFSTKKQANKFGI